MFWLAAGRADPAHGRGRGCYPPRGRREWPVWSVPSPAHTWYTPAGISIKRVIRTNRIWYGPRPCTDRTISSTRSAVGCRLRTICGSKVACRSLALIIHGGRAVDCRGSRATLWILILGSGYDKSPADRPVTGGSTGPGGSFS